MKILLPVDGSEYTKRMLGYVAAHDEMFGSGHDYIVFTAVPSIPVHVTHYIAGDVIRDYQRTRAEEVLEPIRAFARQNGWKIRTSHAIGPAAESIAALIDKERPDLVVMGSHGHTSLGGLALGSVATGVLARCKAPVLLIR